MTAPNKTVDSPFGVFPADEMTLERMEDRVRRLEDDLVELRGVVTRFGDIFIGGQMPEVPKKTEATSALAALVDTAQKVEKLSRFSRFRSWLPFELFNEFSQMSRMYIDPRYRMRRTTQLVAPALALLFVASYFFFNWFFPIPILSSILEKIVDVFLAIILYKILYSELLRYRETLATFDNWTHWRRGGGIVHQGEEPHTAMEME